MTFQQLIVLCDADGTVDMTKEAISRRTGIPFEIICDGIEALECDDLRSRTPDHNGKRILRIDEHRDWGWILVNHNKYKSLQDSDMVRQQTRERVRRHRQSQKNATNEVTNVTDGNAQKRHTDTDTDKHISAFATFWDSYPKKKDKQKAKKAFLKLKPTDDLLSTILRDISSRPDWKEIQFIPLASTYLNGSRWEDEHTGSAVPEETVF